MASVTRIAREYLRLGILNEMQYRVNFFVQIGQSLIAVGTGLIALSLVFRQTESLGGWSRDALLAVMGVHVLVGGVIQMLVQPNMQRLIGEVREGNLDYMLTKPEDSQVLVSLREFRLWQIVDVFIGGSILAVAVRNLGDTVGGAQLLAFLYLLVLGVVMVYCVWLILSTTAFWIIRSGDILEMFASIYQAGRWPVTVYPSWLRNTLTFIVPVAFAVTLPAQSIIAPVDGRVLVFATWLAGILMMVTRAFWRHGLRQYSGASS
jgi:ABC-2 type transport system permease protein